MLLKNRSSLSHAYVSKNSSEVQISVTKTFRVSSSGEFEGSFTQDIKRSTTREVVGYDISADLSKWDRVSPIILPLIPALMDIISRLPDLIQEIQKCSITLFDKTWPDNHVYSGTSLRISSTPDLDIKLPETIEEIMFETVTVGRTLDKLIIQWWFTVVDEELSKTVERVALEESSRGVKFQLLLHEEDYILGKTLSLEDYDIEPLRFARGISLTEEWGR